MTRILARLAVLVLAAGCSTRETPEPVWIGHLAPLSGKDRGRGEEAVQAIQLAMEQAREKELKVEGRALGVRHVDATGKDRARAEAARLIAVNRVRALLVGPGVCEAAEVIAVARPSGVPVVLLDEQPDAVSGEGVHLLGPDPVRRGGVLAEHAQAEVKRKSAILVTDPGSRTCTALADAFTEAWRKGGGTVQTRDEKGLREWVASPKEEPPGVILLAVPAERVVAHLDALGKVPVEVPVLLGMGHAPEIPPGKREVVFTSILLPETNRPPAAQEWAKRYEKRFSRPPGPAALLAADGLSWLLASLENTDSADVRKLSLELGERKEFASLAGDLKWKDGQAQRPLAVYRLREGKRNLVRVVP